MRVCFAASFVLTLFGAMGQPPKGGAISGIITDGSTGEPVRKAAVTVLGKDDAFGVAITGSDGRYLVSGLPRGDYRVWASRDGYERETYGARGPHSPGRIVTLAEGEARADISIRIQPLGAIAGIVLDEEGDPLPRAQVQLLEMVYRRGRPHPQPLRSVTVNENGEYRLFHISPGRYFVLAFSDGGPALRSTAVVTAGQAVPARIFLQQFYPGVNDLASAGVVNVVPGRELRGIDFRLPMREPVQLHGELVVPSDAGAKGQWDIQLFSPDLPDWYGHAHGGQLPRDTFEDVNLAPGKYMLVARLTSDNKQYRGVQTVDVTSGGEQLVTIAVQPTADIGGLVQVRGPGAEKLPNFRVTLQPADNVPLQNRGPTATVKADLSFALRNVPAGVWDVSISPLPAGDYVQSMSLGDQDVLTGDLTTGQKTAGPLKIVIGTRGAKLEGEVGGDALRDGARATIVVCPEGKYSRVRVYHRSVVTDGKGHFHLEGLAPGKYNVYAFEDRDPDVEQDPEMLKRFAAAAIPVELREGETASVKAPLIPADESSRRPE